MPSYPLLPRIDVSINYLASGEFCTNTHHYAAPAAAPTAGQFQTFADLVATNFGEPLKNFLSVGNEFLGVECRYISATAGRYAASNVAAGPGESGSAETPTDDLRLPSGDVVVIQKLGDGPPKRANGTVYLSGINEGDTDGSRLITTSLEEAQSYAEAFEAEIALAATVVTPVVLSRTAALLYDIIGTRVQLVLGHLRRRRPVR
jgi:hypothetical protein